MRVRVLLLGSPGDFTSIVLEGLVSAGVPVRAVALHRPRHPPIAPRSGSIPVRLAGDVATVAGTLGIPLVALDGRSEEQALEAVARHAPDLLAIACFPRVLPERWLGLAPLGAFNLHPSRLPAYRGPTPLFWQFRAGEERMGITLHRATAALDAGPMAAADAVPVAPGALASEVNAALARRGAALLARAIERIATGTLRESAQDESQATWFGWPGEDAFRIPTSWPAERAFRFMRGTREWGRPYAIEAGDETLHAERALDFEARGGREGTLRREKRLATVGFSAGTLRVRCALARIAHRDS